MKKYDNVNVRYVPLVETNETSQPAGTSNYYGMPGSNDINNNPNARTNNNQANIVQVPRYQTNTNMVPSNQYQYADRSPNYQYNNQTNIRTNPNLNQGAYDYYKYPNDVASNNYPPQNIYSRDQCQRDNTSRQYQGPNQHINIQCNNLGAPQQQSMCENTRDYIPCPMPSYSIEVHCPRCSNYDFTKYKREFSILGSIIGIILIVLLFPFSLLILCCCYPCVTPCLKNGNHYCRSCRKYIGCT